MNLSFLLRNLEVFGIISVFLFLVSVQPASAGLHSVTGAHCSQDYRLAVVRGIYEFKKNFKSFQREMKLRNLHCVENEDLGRAGVMKAGSVWNRQFCYRIKRIYDCQQR